MSRVQAVVFAVAALGLTVISIILGLSFLPSRAASAEAGTIIPWMIAWGLIGIAALSGLALAGFLLSSSGGETKRA